MEKILQIDSVVLKIPIVDQVNLETVLVPLLRSWKEIVVNNMHNDNKDNISLFIFLTILIYDYLITVAYFNNRFSVFRFFYMYIFTFSNVYVCDKTAKS